MVKSEKREVSFIVMNFLTVHTGKCDNACRIFRI